MVSEQRETEVAEQRSDVVKKLLGKLPESERTVVTLHYLSEMTAKEIGNFLGVSVNTIKSRLRRGRERLQEAESLVREVLGGVQLSADLTERIMRQVAEINPIVPPPGKPMVPWMALGAAAVLVLLMLGVGNQYLARFQRPYSFEARSEPTIEIVEAPIVIDILSKPAVRKPIRTVCCPQQKGRCRHTDFSGDFEIQCTRGSTQVFYSTVDAVKRAARGLCQRYIRYI